MSMRNTNRNNGRAIEDGTSMEHSTRQENTGHEYAITLIPLIGHVRTALRDALFAYEPLAVLVRI